MSEGLFYLAVRKKDTEPYSFAEVVNLCHPGPYCKPTDVSRDGSHISPTRYGLTEACALVFASDMVRNGFATIIVQRKKADHAINVDFHSTPGIFYVVAKHPADTYFSFTGSKPVGEGLGRTMIPGPLTDAIPESKPRGLLRYTCTQELAKTISNYLDDTHRDSAIICRRDPFDRFLIFNEVKSNVQGIVPEQLEEVTKRSFNHKSRLSWPR